MRYNITTGRVLEASNGGEQLLSMEHIQSSICASATPPARLARKLQLLYSILVRFKGRLPELSEAIRRGLAKRTLDSLQYNYLNEALRCTEGGLEID